MTHYDITETLNMRLTLLQMTFGKHMERKHICFFAGEVRRWDRASEHSAMIVLCFSMPYRIFLHAGVCCCYGTSRAGNFEPGSKHNAFSMEFSLLTVVTVKWKTEE